MRKAKIFIILFTFLICNVGNTAAITVNGNAYLDNKTNHYGIKVVFERVAPSALLDSTTTSTSGDFGINIESGIYDIIYSKDGYFTWIIEEQALYSSTTLTDVTLIKKTTLINVPDTFPAIQSAINVASEGDTVLVAPGTYYENINFNGKNITVASHFLTTNDTTYISKTVIDGSRKARVVTFENGEINSSVLSGFTITNGMDNSQFPSDPYGGGIYCKSSSPVLTNLIISKNYANNGGGIGCHGDSYPILRNLTIINNTAKYGGGIFTRDRSSLTIINVIVNDNTAYYGGGIYFMFSHHTVKNTSICNNIATGTHTTYGGGGIWCDQGTNPILINVTISNNSTQNYGGGIHCQYSSIPNLINCIVSNNKGKYGIYVESSSKVTASYSNFWNNEIGDFNESQEFIGDNVTTNANRDSCDAYYNIQLNPLFVNAENGDYHLSEYSPCIGAGTSEDAPETDIEGNLRGTPPDIGAYENPLSTPLPIHPPTFITSSLPNANVDILYLYTLEVEDPDDNDSLSYLISQGPDWLTIDDSGTLSGIPKEESIDIEVSILVIDSFGLTNILNTTISSIITLYNVPSKFSTIQSAINASADGDTVLVAPGTYYENINFNGKNITVASHFLTTNDTTYISQTVIDGNQNGHVVEFSNGEDSTAVLTGFVITNGDPQGSYPHNCGGGIYCQSKIENSIIYGSNPQLSHLNIINNNGNQGGGIYCDESSPYLYNVSILNNNALWGGGVQLANFSNPHFDNVIIINNTSREMGGGIHLSGSSPHITNTTITNNKARIGGGISVSSTSSSPNIINSIISDNSGDYGLHVEDGELSISYSNFWSNEKGNFNNCSELIGKNVTINANGDSCDAYYNIQLDPRFIDPENGDYHLSEYSPCIGAGSNEDAPETDIEGNLRGTPPDMGAYEHPLNAPPRPPEIITTSLPDATESSEYSFTLAADDPDAGDEVSFEIIDGPAWLVIEESSLLTGTPADEDVGENIPVSIRAYDLYELADTLNTSINVINVNNPPVIHTKTLTRVIAQVAYYDSIRADDADIDDLLTYTLIESPEWMNVTESGVLYGFPAFEDAGEDIPLTLIVSDNEGLADTLQTTLNVIIVNNVNASFKLDTNLSEPGFQGGYTIDNPGPDEYIGFTAYLYNSDSIRSFRINFSWDSTKAVYKSSRSGPSIEEDMYKINGIEDELIEEEDNILLQDDGSITSIVEINEPGQFRVVWAKMGGEAVGIDEGLLYLAVFKTSSDIQINDRFFIDINVDLFDDDGISVPLNSKKFYIGQPLLPPSNLVISDIPDDQGHKLELSWEPSPDEVSGLINYYRIYRSRSEQLTSPIPLTQFTQIDTLKSWELNYTILIDSVTVGTSTYIDEYVPLNSEQYFYWIQAVGITGESDKIAAGIPLNVKSNLIPKELTLKTPFPNPFNPSTTIEYILPEDGHITLTIYNASGQTVKVIKNGFMTAGQYSLTWNAADMSSGIYFCNLKANGKNLTKKTLLIK